MKYYVTNADGVRRKVNSQKGRLQTRHDFYVWYGHQFQWGYGPVNIPEKKVYTANDITAVPTINTTHTVTCFTCIILLLIGGSPALVYMLIGTYSAIMVAILFGIDQRKAREFNENKIIIP